MKTIFKNFGIALVVCTAVAAYPVLAAQPSADQQGLEQLAKTGSDFTKLHQFEFTLRFPSQIAAERADLQLISLAFATRTEPGKTATERVIRASKVMFPVESDLTGLRDKLEAVATAGRGTYEGWRAKPAPAAK